MNYSMTSAGKGEYIMYEFKVRLLNMLLPPYDVGTAKWTGTTRQDSNGIFRPLFEIKIDMGAYNETLLLTQEDFEFLEPPTIL